MDTLTSGFPLNIPHVYVLTRHKYFKTCGNIYIFNDYVGICLNYTAVLWLLFLLCGINCIIYIYIFRDKYYNSGNLYVYKIATSGPLIIRHTGLDLDFTYEFTLTWNYWPPAKMMDLADQQTVVVGGRGIMLDRRLISLLVLNKYKRISYVLSVPLKSTGN